MADNDLNEEVVVTVDDASVITVPIDDTLTNSGEAADAKAVGDALALKADKSELQTAVTVNGQSADNQGHIIVSAADTKMSSTDNTTVKSKIEAIDGKTAADIPVSSEQGAQTIAQALSSGATRKADSIEMSDTDTTTVKQAIETVAGDLDTLEETVSGLNERTAADIKYKTGSNETIKQHVDALDQGLVKSVNEIGPDPNGNVNVEIVPYADNLYSTDGEQVDDDFIIRTTAGSGALSDGYAWPIKLKGNRVHTGYTAESIEMTVSPMPRTTPAAITASINEATFEAYVETAGTYTLNYTTSWSADPTLYGLTVSNTPINGDQIVIVWDGETDATVTVNAATRTAPAPITAVLDRDTFVSYVESSGTITLTYSTQWSADPALYGITVSNIPVAGDAITVVYVKEVPGTITQANPSRLVGTGWNLYNHANGYAHVVKYSNVYGYAIGGTYTSLAFATTPTGTQSAITPDEDGLFNVPSDGYVIVTGGNGTDTAIWTTWSDWDEGYEGEWQPYTEHDINLASVMSSYLPYGLCKVDTVTDEIDFTHMLVINRISRVENTAENLAAAKANGRPYEYDEDYIYQVRASEVTNSVSLTDEYLVNEHGLEFFDGSSVEVYSEILYGANLKDKLRRDVVTISEQTLTAGQKKQIRANIGAASVALEDGLAVVVDGNKTSHVGGAAKDDYVLVKNSTITGVADGGYTAAKAIPANTVIDSTYLTACSKGIANSLSEQIVRIPNVSSFTNRSQIQVNPSSNVNDIKSYQVQTSGFYILYGDGATVLALSATNSLSTAYYYAEFATPQKISTPVFYFNAGDTVYYVSVSATANFYRFS